MLLLAFEEQMTSFGKTIGILSNFFNVVYDTCADLQRKDQKLIEKLDQDIIRVFTKKQKEETGNRLKVQVSVNVWLQNPPVVKLDLQAEMELLER